MHVHVHTHTHTHSCTPLCKKRFHGDETEKQHRRRGATDTAIINLKNLETIKIVLKQVHLNKA